MAPEWSDKAHAPPVDDDLPSAVVETVMERLTRAQKAPRIWQKLGWVLWAGVIAFGGMIDWAIWGGSITPISMEGGDYGLTDS